MAIKNKRNWLKKRQAQMLKKRTKRKVHRKKLGIKEQEKNRRTNHDKI